MVSNGRNFVIEYKNSKNERCELLERPLRGHQILKYCQNWKKMFFFILLQNTTFWNEVSNFAILRWCDYVHERVKYFQVMNLGAFERPKVVIFKVWIIFSCISFDWIEQYCSKWPMPYFFKSQAFLVLSVVSALLLLPK